MTEAPDSSDGEPADEPTAVEGESVAEQRADDGSDVAEQRADDGGEVANGRTDDGDTVVADGDVAADGTVHADGTAHADGAAHANSAAADSAAADSAADRATTADADGAAGAPPAGATRPESTAIAAADPELAEELGEPRKLDPRVRYRWIVGRILGAVLLGAGIAFLAWQFGPIDDVQNALRLGGGIFALTMLYATVRAVLLYRTWRYVVRAESLYLTRGVFTKVQTVVPYVRVQHIDTRRSPFERLLGLSSLVVYTAGSRGADVSIPGLTEERASTLQYRLERLAIESEDEDAV